MSPRYDDEWVGRMLDTRERLGPYQAEELLAKTGLAEGQTAVDVGCGPGLLTIPAAVVVGPSGRVHAVDIEQKMLDLVHDTAASRGLDNITTVFSSGQSIPLPDHVADYAMCALLLHDCDGHAGKVAMARDIARLLRPGGRMLVVEFVPRPEDEEGRRMTSDETKAVLREARLDSTDPEPLGEGQYMLIATPSPPG